MKPRELDPLALPLTGTQIIEASAGTGKTYTITTIVLRLLLETELAVDQIVVVTFTRAATSELRDRIRQRIVAAASAFEEALEYGERRRSGGDAVIEHLVSVHPFAPALRRLRRALRDLDRAAIFTIHGFAQRMLQEHAFESGARFDLELVGDQRSLTIEVAHDFWAREIATLPEDIWRAVEAWNVSIHSFSALAQVAVAGPDLPLHVDVVDVSREELEQQLRELSGAWSAAAEEYRKRGAEAFKLLSAPSLHQTYYKPAKLEEYRRQLDEWLFDEPQHFHEVPAAIHYLAAGNIKTKQNHPKPKHPLFEAMEQLEQALENSRASTARFVDALRCRFVHFARAQVASEHEHAGTQSFDDLLHSMRRALADRTRGSLLARQVRQRFPVALIDEFQDTDPVQYDIFKKIYVSAKTKSGGLFLIGDPKQAIYAFRGADIHAYLDAVQSAGDNLWTLTTNYRSDPGFVSALNHVFSRLEEPFLHPGIQYTRVSAAPGRRERLFRDNAPVTPLEIVYLNREDAGRVGSGRWDGTEEWQRLAAEEVARLLQGGLTVATSEGPTPVAPKHIAVLTRTNRQAQDIQEHLRSLGVPSVLHGDRTVFEAPEATELALVLRALAEPSSGSAVRTALSTRFLGLDAHALASLAKDEGAWEEWTLRFREWNDIWAERGVMQCLQTLLRDRDLVPRTLRDLDGERRMTNFRHLAELLHQAECERHLGIPGLLQWYDEVRLDPTRQGMAPEAQQLRLESDADAVVLTTMHRSKGLEFPIVVLPFLGARSEPFGSELDNLKFHNPERGHRLELDVRARPHKPEAIELATREHQAEAMRLAYVALTRACHHCVVLWGGVTAAFSSLGYLLHQPAEQLGGLAVDIAARLKSLDDAGRWTELQSLAEGSAGTIGVRRAKLEAPPVYVRPDLAEKVSLEARRFEGRVPSGLRTNSFSGMARGIDADRLSARARDGRDVDEETSLGPPIEEKGAESRVYPAGDERRITLADFPRGAKPGELLHGIFEKISFDADDEQERRSVIESELGRHGFSAEHLPVLQQAVEEILQTPLDADSAWTLAALTPSQRISEMEFTLPVGLSMPFHSAFSQYAASQPAASQSVASPSAASHRAAPHSVARAQTASSTGGAMTIREMSEALRNEREAPWPPDYLERLARLDAGVWTGFLRGFIDLVFERDGRFFIVDYKSNYLGPHPDHYRRELLEQVMSEHHYYLQYLLYSVALHRYLSQRLRDYDAQRHFGGVYYLFLRGMHPSTGAERGVFFHRPSSELLDRVSQGLAGTERRMVG